MYIRKLEHSDYDEILTKWWKDWRWSAPPRDFLPEEMIGVEDGIPGMTRHEDDPGADAEDGGGFEE